MKHKHIHFVGIGGIGMSSLAQHFLHLKYTVSGSDITKTDLTDMLCDLGAKVFYKHSKDNIADTCDLVVYTSAVPRDNSELVEAQKRNIKCVLREQLLGLIFNSYQTKVAVCGVHGKTTVTSMIDYVLRKADVSHTSFVGGLLCDTKTNYTHGENIVVAEACEYKKSFLNLYPDILVALNVEHDHPDYYKTEQDVKDAFSEFFANVTNGVVVVCGDSVDKDLYKNSNYITYGLQEDNIYTAKNIVRYNSYYEFDLYRLDQKLSTVKLHNEGKHNIYNALATLVVVSLLNLDFATSIPLIADFCGIERRFMHLPCSFCNLVEDYAHHPTEIQATIDTAKCYNYQRIFVAFQPHTYTRTATFWKQFTECFTSATEVLLLPIYSAREAEITDITSANLCRDINKIGITPAYYFDTPHDCYHYIKEKVTSSDLVLVLGAGDIYKLSKYFKDK